MYIRTELATDDSIPLAHCMMDTKGYKHTFRSVMFIALPLQQWLHERASMFLYTYISCLYYYSTELLRQEENIACCEMIACGVLETSYAKSLF